jgi:hypothetical protein
MIIITGASRGIGNYLLNEFANSLTFPAGYIYPVIPSDITSVLPPASLDIIGQPCSIASSKTLAHPSHFDGRTKKSNSG